MKRRQFLGALGGATAAMAARGARAAAGDAGDWVSAKHIARWHRAPSSCIPPGLEGDPDEYSDIDALDLCQEL